MNFVTYLLALEVIAEVTVISRWLFIYFYYLFVYLFSLYYFILYVNFMC